MMIMNDDYDADEMDIHRHFIDDTAVEMTVIIPGLYSNKRVLAIV